MTSPDLRMIAAIVRDMKVCPGCQGAEGCAWHVESMTEMAAWIVEILADAEHLTSDRCAHSLQVGQVAKTRTDWPLPAGVSRDEVAAIATLHDLGYAYPDTGMHAVDGARVLASAGFPREWVAQVAWHSTAQHEVRARGIGVDLLEEFGAPDPQLHDLIWAADFTTSPDGGSYAVADRCSDIRRRYPADSPVVEALDASIPDLAQVLIRLLRYPADDVEAIHRLLGLTQPTKAGS